MRQEARRWALPLLAVWLLAGAGLPAPAGDDKRVRLEIEVVADKDGQPIENASVYIKFKEGRLLWRDKKRTWSVKTNREGKAVLPTLPEGRVLVQVVVPGWKTYGRFHTIQGPKQTIKVQLRRPKRWY